MEHCRILTLLIIGILLISAFPMMGIERVKASDGGFGGGSGTEDDPYLIEDIWDLQAMNDNLSAHYALKNEIDASETLTWNSGEGFYPIGESYAIMDYKNLTFETIERPFTGSLDGRGHTISGLFIDRIERESIGLFGHIGDEGSIKDLVLMDCRIAGNVSVGCLVGFNEGTVVNSHCSGEVKGALAAGGLVGANIDGTLFDCRSDVRVNGSVTWNPIFRMSTGGLVGSNKGTIEHSFSKGNVLGKMGVGGLVGTNEDGTVRGSRSESYVSGEGSVGGLIGQNNADIEDCSASGDVYSEGIAGCGGLIGFNEDGTITNCHATGNASGPGYVGGLVGGNGGTVKNCHATGNAEGGGFTGGLIGYNGGPVSTSYSTGEIRGTEACLGGLIGRNGGEVTICFSSGNVLGEDDYNGGLVGFNEGEITNCFSTGSAVSSGDYIGGLVGSNIGGQISYCYSTGVVDGSGENIGGLVGMNMIAAEGTLVEESYWDMKSSGQNSSDGGVGKTTIEMFYRFTYPLWDFSWVWDIIEGMDYPFLQDLPPSARILSPKNSGTLVEGDALFFSGSFVPSPTIGYHWSFGDGRTASNPDPGMVRFNSVGTWSISYTFLLDGREHLGKDSRTYEVVDGSLPYPDLEVADMKVPDTLAIGESSLVSYSVRNTGDNIISGPSWKDAVYLSKDPYLDHSDTFLSIRNVTEKVPIGGSYQGVMNITLPPMREGVYHLIVSANDGWGFVERHRLNNERAETIDVAITELQEDIQHTSDHTSGSFEHFYRLHMTTGGGIHLSLDGSEGIEIMVRHGDLPTRAIFDQISTSGDLVVMSAYAGTWYVLVRGEDQFDNGTYSIKYSRIDLMIESIAPERHVLGIPMDLIISGIGFFAPVQVELVGSTGATYPAGSTSVDTNEHITAHFQGDALGVGVYTVRVIRPGSGTAELQRALEILAKGKADFGARIIMPASVGYKAPATFYVEYWNNGDLSMPAPLVSMTGTQKGRQAAQLTLDADSVRYGIWSDYLPRGFSTTVRFLASGEYPGILNPGESGRIPVYYTGWLTPWDGDNPPIEWTLNVADTGTEVDIDWGQMKDATRPDDVTQEAWDHVWERFTHLAGETYTDFVDLLRDNALYLYFQGQRVIDPDRLIALTIRQAEGFCPIPSLFSHQDVSADGTGLPLVFERHYINSLRSRFDAGPLGYGWVHNWQIELSEKDHGTVEIVDHTGTIRSFVRDLRDDDGYLAQPGDGGELKDLSGGRHRLTEINGEIMAFNSRGELEYVEDANGNRITCTYTDRKLTGLDHSSGGSIEISYNGQGRIDAVTDDLGRYCQYTYDNGHLISVLFHDGFSMHYDYDKSDGAPSEHAIIQVGVTGEDDLFMGYDPVGRLSSIHRGSQRESTTFMYDRFSVGMTDSLGNTNVFQYDHAGHITRFEDPLGETYRYVYDPLGRLKEIVDPAGISVNMEHDEFGDLAVIKDQLGLIYRFKYSGEVNRLERYSDPYDANTLYGYDGDGNLMEVVQDDRSNEIWSYDERGNPVTWKNRRGNTTTYSYDSQGRLTGKLYSDGDEIQYDYDDRGNMVRIEDPHGITNVTYDQYDRVIRIHHPGDRWLEFTYDDARRRNSSLDQLGNRLDYGYDGSGRLEVLTDGNGTEVVRYQYDGAGRLYRMTLGNGVRTTYGYDAVWRIIGIESRAPDGSVISSFNYTYDSRGRRTGVETHYGTWTYGFDDSGQLLSAVLVSDDPMIPSTALSYVYDRNGNRIKTIRDGAEGSCSVNGMNGYSRFGDHNFSYDLDGNLIRDEGPEGVVVYEYDDENRLIGAMKRDDNWEYIYDGLGNRVATTHNGTTSFHVFDPIGSGNMVGTYDEFGDLSARYIYGIGLVGFETGVGGPYYYSFDAMGSTDHITDNDGSIVDSYAYLPFGGTLHANEAVSNPFMFVGEHGVTTDPTGLLWMRARYYDPQIGRFHSPDPIGLSGGDMNLYRYVRNSPTDRIDPDGLQVPWGQVLNPGNFIPWTNVGNAAGGSVGGAIGAGLDVYGGVKSVGLGASILLLPAAGVLGVMAGIGLLAWGAYNIISGIGTILEFFGISLSWSPKDPNQKLVTAGFGPENHLPEGTMLSYHVDFENMEEATAPAQVVTITDPLAEELDWSTFEFTQIAFGDMIIPMEQGTRYVDRIIEYQYRDGEYDLDIEVHIDGGIDMDTGVVHMNFYSIDPETGIPPAVDVGFLPPEDDSGRGKGYFEYLISPMEGLPTGTAIRNIATIQFNFGLEIDTNQIDPMDRAKGTDPEKEALVTIDGGPPRSWMNPMPEYVGNIFPVSWSGDDGEGGSGVGVFDIYVSENDGPWIVWIEGTNLTTEDFQGVTNSTYSFYCIATDNVGHRESKDPAVEAETTVKVFTSPVANAGPDLTVEIGYLVTFDGSASSDEFGIANYTWTFDIGADHVALYGVAPSYLFEVPGIYSVTLNVTNSYGQWDIDIMMVIVEEPSVERGDDEPSPWPVIIITVIALITSIILIMVIALIILLVARRKGGPSSWEE